MARCQVCDGPIVNGRCKLCGMPYRNDEILYHLNESRSDHFKHATPKVREQMKANQIPISDREYKKPVSEEKKGKKKNKTLKKSTMSSSQTHTKKWTAEVEKGKKHSKLAIGVAVFVLAASLFSSVMEYIDDKRYEIRWAENNRAEEIPSEYVETDDLLLLGILDSSTPEIVVGDRYEQEMIMPGTYALETSGGYVGVVVQYAQSGEELFFYDLKGEGDQIILELHEGDQIFLGEHRRQEDSVLIFQIEQYDETTSM